MDRFVLSSQARGSVETWAAGAQVLTLLTTLHAKGWTRFLAEPRDHDALIRFSGLAPTRVADIVAALEANGVVEQQDGTVRLSPAFEALAADDAFIRLTELLDKAEVTNRLTRTIVEEPGPLPLTEADALVIARAAGGRPTSVTRALFEQSLVPQVPETVELIRSGRWLDVGCGVAGATLTFATMLPELQAVAIELVPAVAAETVRRVEALGVSDRVEIRCMDAQDLAEEDVFAGAFWAQPFFPEAARAGTLAAIRRALVPGGTLVMQEMEPEPQEADRAAYALRRLIAQGREVPFGRTAEELAAEAGAAGFELIRIAVTDFGRMVLVRRPA